jgi:F-type H+-transporting ATPase subunit b
MTPLAASSGSSSGSFLISPNVGLMIWTLVVFAISVVILNRAVFPRIRDALDRRQKAIEESIDSQERLRAEAEQILVEYRDQLAQARLQAEEIISRAREAGKEHERETLAEAHARREKLLEQTKRDIQTETQRALEQIRNEVATLTILATEKVTRKTLSATDQRKLVEEALGELDFSVLEGSEN